MATESNNIQINTFNKGMNTDTSLDMIPEGLYIFGQNIRITNNSLLGSIIDSNSTEGIITPVNSGEDVTDTTYPIKDGYKILATASIEDIGAVIINNGDQTWSVYRINFGDTITFSKLFTSERQESIKDKFSVVINREIESVVKLYIADGIHQLMLINLMDDDYNAKITGNTDNITSNRLYPNLQTNITKLISGQLKTSQVQYTYRLYKKYGICSKLAPITSKILIIDPNRNKEEGNAEDTTTSVGLLITIPLNDLDIDTDVFDHIQVFRLTYLKAQEDATVDLIYDSFIKNDNLVINDGGNNSILEYSIDEFSALNELILVPQNIELNLNYLFASNVEDKTILRIGSDAIDIDSKAYLRGLGTLSYGYDEHWFLLRNNNDPNNKEKYSELNKTGYKIFKSVDEIESDYDVNPLSIMNPDSDDETTLARYGRYMYDDNDKVYYWGGEGKNVNYKFVTTELVVHDNFNQNSPSSPYTTGGQNARSICYIQYDLSSVANRKNTDDYLKQHGITAIKSLEYDDIIASSMFRSLRRDEVYRYGIIYYDKYGTRSDVLWIGDIRTPTIEDSNSFKIIKNEAVINNYKQYILVSGTSGVSLIEDGQGESGGTTYYCSSSYTTTSSDVISVKYDGSVTLNNYIISSNTKSGTIYGSYTAKLVINEDEYDLETGLIVSVSKNDLIYIKLISPHLDGYLVTLYNGDETPSELSYYREAIGDCNDGYANDRLFTTTIDAEISFLYNDVKTNELMSNPLGLLFDIKIPEDTGIESFLIVRCSKQNEYSKTITQCALSRPIRQTYSTVNSASLKSPYYPTPFLTSQMITTKDAPAGDDNGASGVGNNQLFLLHSPEISIFPEDSLSLIQKNDSKLNPIGFCYEDTLLNISFALSGFLKTNSDLFTSDINHIYYARHVAYGAGGDHYLYKDGASGVEESDMNSCIDFKSQCTCNLYLYNIATSFQNTNGDISKNSASIEAVSDVQVPTWEQGFSNIQLSGSNIVAGVKAYKSYTSIVKTDEYVNWICNGMYNLRLCLEESQDGLDGEEDDDLDTHVFTYDGGEENWHAENRNDRARGWIGPGPQCLLVKISDESDTFKNMISCSALSNEMTLGSLICNVQHTAQQFAGFTDQEKLFDIYYGFGNFGKLESDGNGNMVGSLIVFDGDVYNLPCELVSMYKTYNFNSIYDTIPSAQVVNYVPLETKINTFFDYGMNYRNTSSPNLQVEPGEITGVCSLDRPLHQYNSIYSDNNVSNDVYNAQSEEESVEKYTQRIFYSQLKTNGEFLDKWSDFRSLDYIDADTRYGSINHMLTNKDVLYFWQSTAFGKLSVNERSLITDNNNNTILLGQGGVLQRTDYLDTHYGIREDDRSAINTPDGIFWIDVFNKAILGSSDNKVINYGERLNVLNLINSKLNVEASRPAIDYDMQNSELLCKCFDGDLLIFNTKLNCASSMYTREYIDTIKYNNIIYGLAENNMTQFNYLNDDTNSTYLSDVVLKFVVNQVPTTTKVFDNQLINTLKRSYDDDFTKTFMASKTFNFTTNLNTSSLHSTDEIITDREGNICYTIPRIDNETYGNRLRGRWMLIDMIDSNPQYNYAISNILTKFRQSFN